MKGWIPRCTSWHLSTTPDNRGRCLSYWMNEIFQHPLVPSSSDTGGLVDEGDDMRFKQRKRINGGSSIGAVMRAAIIILASLCLIAGMVFSAFTLWTVYPPNERSDNADVVVVIAGASDGRHELGAKIAADYGIENFVVSNPAGARDKVGYSHCQGKDQPEGTTTWCMDPYPVITSGEARTFHDLAEEQNWESAIMVTSRPHTRRVNYFFNECTNLTEVKVANVRSINENIIIYQVFHEAAGFIKYWLTDPCSDI